MNISNIKIKHVGIAIIIAVIMYAGYKTLPTVKTSQKSNSQNSFFFTQTTDGLDDEKETEIVDLNNGDTFTLTAKPVKKIIDGKEFRMLSYNNSVPGPVLRVRQGDEITIDFKNEIDMETTLHSHGIRMDNEFDGVPDVTQDPVEPGDSFTYRLKFPDPGIYWYHPHIREDYQQDLGMYGNIIVLPKDDTYWSRVNSEEFLVLDDILIENGTLTPFRTELSDHSLMGRFGNVMLVNGNTDYSLSVNKGDVVRFYVTNTANVRPFNISFEGAQMKLVGGDNGKYEYEEMIESLTISPSERYIVEVHFPDTDTYRLIHKTPDRTYTLGTVKGSETQSDTSFIPGFQAISQNTDTQETIDPFRSLFTKPVDKEITLSINMGDGAMNMMMQQGMGHMMPDGTFMANHAMGGVEKIEWEDEMGMMNISSTPEMISWQIRDDKTLMVNEDIDWKFRVGETVKMKIFNDPNSMHPMQHPIHLHGQRFLVLSKNGEEVPNKVWKDTILVETGDTVEILVEMSNPGKWMIHCHIAEHLESGMMASFEVI